MIIYKVTETLVEIDKAGGEGYFSSLHKAQDAILKRVAEVYTEEEMKHFKFTGGGYRYETFGNEDIFDCLYEIEELVLDEFYAD